MLSRETKRGRVSFLQWMFPLLLLCLLLGSVSASAATAKSLKITLQDEVLAEINAQAGGDEHLKAGLIALSAAENGGKKTLQTPSLNKNGTYDHGPMQINDVSLGHCADLLKISKAEVKALFASADYKVALPPSIACAKKIFVTVNGKSCTAFAAQLCAYNRGGGWCTGCKKCAPPAGPPHPDVGGCGYDLLACARGGVDCGAGAVKKDPGDGSPIVVAGEVMNTGADGSPPQEGAINCPDLDLANAMQEATAAFSNAAVINLRTTFEASPRSDIRGTQCLIGFLRYFDLIRAILDAVNAVKILLLSLVPMILEAVCNYVLQAVKNLIDTALSYLCIPTIPGLHLPPLPPARACKGTPLVTFGWGTPPSGPGAAPPFFVNMSRGISGPGGAFRF